MVFVQRPVVLVVCELNVDVEFNKVDCRFFAGMKSAAASKPMPFVRERCDREAVRRKIAEHGSTPVVLQVYREDAPADGTDSVDVDIAAFALAAEDEAGLVAHIVDGEAQVRLDGWFGGRGGSLGVRRGRRTAAKFVLEEVHLLTDTKAGIVRVMDEGSRGRDGEEHLGLFLQQQHGGLEAGGIEWRNCQLESELGMDLLPRCILGTYTCFVLGRYQAVNASLALLVDAVDAVGAQKQVVGTEVRRLAPYWVAVWLWHVR